MRKVWYCQIWIQTNLGFIVLILFYMQLQHFWKRQWALLYSNILLKFLQNMNATIEFANRTWCWHQQALQYSFCPDPNEVPQSTNTGNIYIIDTVNIFYLVDYRTALCFIDYHQKYSRLRCLLRVKVLVIFFIWAAMVVFFSSKKI